MSLIITDLQELFRQTFGGSPYVIKGDSAELSQGIGSALTAINPNDPYGQEIWLPVKFTGLDASIFGSKDILLPYSVISISSSKTIVKTSLSERKGTVKEYFSAEDYQIQIKGFVIDESKRTWPEKELILLKKLDDLKTAVQLDNALTNIFLDINTRVVITNLQLPEVQGRNHIRPFSFSLESDSIFTLDVDSDV
jgi:Domain of unknown function (DUF6046)